MNEQQNRTDGPTLCFAEFCYGRQWSDVRACAGNEVTQVLPDRSDVLQKIKS